MDVAPSNVRVVELREQFSKSARSSSIGIVAPFRVGADAEGSYRDVLCYLVRIPMSSPSSTIFAGIKGTVVAIDRESGEIRWRADLKGADFVNVTLQGGDLFAASKGRLYRLDPTTGNILWCNELPGLGYGIVTVAGASQAAGPAEQQRRQAQAAAAASGASS